MGKTLEHTELQAQALAAARRGLDFMVRQQIKDMASADHGRFAYVYDCNNNKHLTLTSNWITGVSVAAMLLGYQVFRDSAYLEAAQRGASYLKSLQSFDPRDPRYFGLFHENTPQTPMLFPRDGLTAAWALFDYAAVTGDEDAGFRAGAYADWLLKYGMNAGYPRWTVSFETFDASPRWFGSFHSGSALFMARMYEASGDVRYLDAMRQILAVYNELMLTADGQVHVIVDIATRKPLKDAHNHPELGHMVPEGWIIMHEYNDDFGSLAALEAWRITGEAAYLKMAERFLANMLRSQCSDGGFGRDGRSVPSASGSVLLELLAARSLGADVAGDAAIGKVVNHLLGLQVKREGDPADGAFLGYTSQYQFDGATSNARTGCYAVLALLRFAGAEGDIYFPRKN